MCKVTCNVAENPWPVRLPQLQGAAFSGNLDFRDKALNYAGTTCTYEPQVPKEPPRQSGAEELQLAPLKPPYGIHDAKDCAISYDAMDVRGKDAPIYSFGEPSLPTPVPSSSRRALAVVVREQQELPSKSVSASVLSCTMQSSTTTESTEPCPYACIIHLYQLERVQQIGTGGFSIVDECIFTPGNGESMRTQGGEELREGSEGLKAACGMTSMRVAVKKMKDAHLIPDADPLALRMEAELMMRLKHKNVVGYIGHGWLPNTSKSQQEIDFLVQEYMQGGTLEHLVRTSRMEHPTYTMLHSVKWMLNVAEGLEYLHTQKPMVLHRDLKLGNIMLSEGNLDHAEAKLGDFGLSTVVREQDCMTNRWCLNDSQTLEKICFEDLDMDSDLNDTEEACADTAKAPHSPMSTKSSKARVYDLEGRIGSYTYMAPEVYMKLPYNELADTYSFGIMLHEMMHHRTIFSTLRNRMPLKEYAHEVAYHGRRPSIGEHVPSSVAKLIQSCWQSDARMRPSMSEVKASLQKIKSHLEAKEKKAHALTHKYEEMSMPKLCGVCTIM